MENNKIWPNGQNLLLPASSIYLWKFQMTDENIPKIKSLSALRAALEPDTAELQWLISDALVNKHGHDPSDAEQIARTYLTGEDDAVSHVIEGLKIEEVNTLLAVMGIGPEEVKAGIEKMERLLAPKGPA